jgi:hypothetical protein
MPERNGDTEPGPLAGKPATGDRRPVVRGTRIAVDN